LTLSVLRIVRFSVSESVAALSFMDMRSKDEFYFALSEHIHRILTSPQTSNQSQTLHRLKEAHPDLNFDPFLSWRLRFDGTGVG
jgi:hypothetical protein